MLALPIFQGRPTYCPAVKNMPVACFRQKKAPVFRLRLLCWRYLSSRAVARQVLSAQMSLTSVFGMGTGGPSLQSTPTHMDGVCPIFYINAPSGFLPLVKLGDPYRIRTDVNGVRGRCLNHLTNGPFWCTLRDSNPGPTD